MASVASDVEASLSRALFSDDNDDAVRAPAPVDVGSSHLRQGGIPRDQMGHVLADPRNPEPSSRLLVGGGDENEGVRGRVTALSSPRDLACHDRHGGRQVEHVDGSTSPHHPVLDRSAEGVARPLALVDRDDVGVSEQGQRPPAIPVGSGGVCPDRHDEGGSARVRGHSLHGDGNAVEEVFQDLDCAFFPSRVCGEVVDAPQAHQPRE